MTLATVGCAPSPSNGGLWSQQQLQQELALFRLSDAQRADGARAYQLSLADDQLATERTRLAALLEACPGPVQPLGFSPNDRLRDGIRIQAQDDSARLTSLAQLALADWQLRRAASTGDDRFCQLARATLAGRSQSTSSVVDPFATPHAAMVQRDPVHPGLVLQDPAFDFALSSYALGTADTVRAASPLPEYLAAVYGGTATGGMQVTVSNDTPREVLVDELAPAHAEWEPDALYAALLDG